MKKKQEKVYILHSFTHSPNKPQYNFGPRRYRGVSTSANVELFILA